MEIIFYSTGCPKCSVLNQKLKNKNIEFKTVTDIDEMIELGIQSAPVLSVDGKLLKFSDAIKWVNSIKEII